MSVTQATLLGDAFGIEASGTIPIGGIIMWSGTIATIPTGWSLCNGNNGVAINGLTIPDLRNRFIVGAGSNYNPADTGGADSVTLTSTQIPSHTHPYAFAQGSGAAIGNDYVGTGISNVVDRGGINELEQSGRPDGPNLNAFTADTAPSGGGAEHENRPPYYALAFIMRVS